MVSKSDADLSFGLANVLYVTFVTLINVDCVEGGARDLIPYLLSFALRAEGDNRRTGPTSTSVTTKNSKYSTVLRWLAEYGSDKDVTCKPVFGSAIGHQRWRKRKCFFASFWRKKGFKVALNDSLYVRKGWFECYYKWYYILRKVFSSLKLFFDRNGSCRLSRLSVVLAPSFVC